VCVHAHTHFCSKVTYHFLNDLRYWS